MATVAELMVKINGDMSGLEKSLQGASGKMQAFGDGMMQKGMAASAAFTAPIVAGAAVIGTLAQDAIDYQGQMNEVFTLMPGATKDAMGKMSGDVLQFAKDMGVIPQEVAPALYQAISAGVPADNVFAFLEIAQKAAIGGVTDLTTAVDGISTVVNSYGEDVIDAATASDLMFTAVRLGKTTFEELSASLFNTLPTASALGVSFEDVTAAMSTMTAQGVPTSVATTQMRQLLVELSKEGGQAANTFEQLAGKSFKDFIASGGDVSGALGIMHEHAQDTGRGINDLFGSVEAGNAALALAGDNAQTYINHVNEMQGAAGATQAAFETMEEGVGRQMEKLSAEFAAAKIEIGDKFLPIIVDTLIPIFRDQVMPLIEKVADFIGNMAEKFAELDPGVQTFILGAIGILAALGPVLIVAGMMVSAIGALIPVFALIVSPVGLVILAIIALIAIGVALWKNWDAIKGKAVEIWSAIKDFFVKKMTETRDFFVNIWNEIKSIFTGAGSESESIIVRFYTAIFDFIKNTFNAVRDFFSTIWGRVKEVFNMSLTDIWELIKRMFSAYVDFVVNFGPNVLKAVHGIWNAVNDYMGGLPAKMLDYGKNIIQGLINGIKNMAGNLKGVISDVVSGAVNSVKSFLGIKSPSKLFEGFGVNIGDGLVSGIDRMKNAVSGSMQNLVTPPQMAMAGGGSLSGSSSGGSSGTTIIIELDGRQIGRAAFKHLPGEIRIKTGLKN